MRGITRDYAESANHLPADPLAITIGTSAISGFLPWSTPFAQKAFACISHGEGDAPTVRRITEFDEGLSPGQ